MKTLFRLLFVALIAVIAYNYFVGNEEDRESSEKVVEEVKDLGKAIGDLVRSEKEKYNEGEYDDVLDRLGEMLDQVKKRAKEIDLDIFKETSDIEKSKKKLEDTLKEKTGEDGLLSEENKEAALKELKILQDKLEQLGKDIAAKE